MATLSQLTAQRAAAGARYTAAIAELHAALVDLAALDDLLNNSNVSPGTPPVPTFHEVPDVLPWPLSHPVYAPRTLLPHWRDEIQVTRTMYLAGFTGA